MSRIRCKFTIRSVTPNVTPGSAEAQGGAPTSATVTAQAVYDGSPENRQFSQYTPWGTLEFGVDNPAALPAFLEGGALAPGREFYLDLTPVAVEQG